MVRARHDDERLVLALEELERVLAEVARMSLLAVNEQDGAPDFSRIRQERHVDEGQRRGRIPPAVRIERTLVVPALRLVVVPVVGDELRLGAKPAHERATPPRSSRRSNPRR